MRNKASLVAGLVRVGSVATGAPWRTMLAFAVLLAVAAVGLARLEVDDGLEDFLRSDSDVYRTYETMRSSFRTGETDILILARPGPDLGAALGRLRDIHLDLGLSAGVTDVYSMFSVYEDVNGRPMPVIPDALPEGEAAEALASRIARHPGIEGTFLSTDGEPLVVYIVGLDRGSLEESGLIGAVDGFAGEVEFLEQAYGVDLVLTGAPAMRAEMLKSSRRDSVVFNVAGFAVGLLACIVLFGNARFVVVVIVPPAVSVVFALGMVGFLGVALNPLIIAVIPLVLVVAFANALHLAFAIRRGLQSGRDIRSASSEAMAAVGPACALSALTTAIALGSLLLADTPLINDFGRVAAVATVLSLMTVVAMVPALAALLLADLHVAGRAAVAGALDRWFARLSPRILRAHRAITITGLALIVGSGLLFVQLEPRYRLLEVISGDGEAREAALLLNERFGGISGIYVLVSSDTPFADDWRQARAALAGASAVLEAQPGLGRPRSLLAVLPEDGGSDILETVPRGLLSRLLSADGTMAVVTASAPDMEAVALGQLRADVEDGLAALDNPGFAFGVTGLSTVSAERAIRTINNLTRALLVAMLIVFVTIGLLFRSVELAVLGVFANLFAVLGAAAWLYVTGTGLQYVTVVGLTVAFGLAVDDTIHFLNRYRLSRHAGMGTYAALRTTIERIGSILVLTTVVVVCGMASMLLSDVTLTRIFGTMCMVTLLVALVGDVIFLPALTISVRRLRGRGRANP